MDGGRGGGGGLGVGLGGGGVGCHLAEGPADAGGPRVSPRPGASSPVAPSLIRRRLHFFSQMTV